MTDEELIKFGFRTAAQHAANFTKQFPNKVPANKGLLGPEYPGCFNTGTRALIYRTTDKMWLVGRQNDVEDARAARFFHQNIGKRVIKIGTGKAARKVYHVKTRASAIKLWAALCEADSRIHAHERAEVATAADKLRNGTPEEKIAAALTLHDHGAL